MSRARPARPSLRAALLRLLTVAALALTGLVGLPAAAHAANYNVLVFSKTAGFRHDSIAAGVTAVQQLGAANGFTVEATEDAAAFTDANLARFATVVFLSTTGDVLDANQQAAFERYIRAGGGYAGVHAASDTEYGWAWYGSLVGAYFSSHPAVQNATVKVEDPAHPSTASLPAKWIRSDEWYAFQSNPRGRVHVLASLDERSYAPGTATMGADHPIAWCQNYDGGRSWYTAAGHDAAAFSDTAFRAHLLGGIQTTANAVGADCGATRDAGFSKVTLDSNTSNPMELDVAADGRVFYIERDGRVQIIKPTTGTTVTAVTLPVFTGNEDGLLGMRLDPSFAANGWIYLYYSPTTGGPRNQVSRFTVSGDTIDPATEKVLLQVTTQRNTCCHAGGSMTFDSAGNLYLATGDNTNPFESDGFAPLDERAGRQDYDSQRSAGNTNDLRGKILRIKPQADGTYTVPAGNLFAPGTAQTRAEIYAMGFRNPFRIGVDKATNTLYVADYGPDAGAANANRGPEGTVEWNIVGSAGNYGWPYCIGNNYAYVDYTFPSGPSSGAYNCAAPVNNSPNNTGLTNLPPARPATVDYDYGGNPLFPEIGGGGAPMGGPVYRYSAALVSDRKWPAYYDGKALFGEWNQNKLYTMQVTPDGKSLVDINNLFASMSFLRPMDLEFGPDGAMYLIEWGTGFGGNNADSGIYRIDYNSGNRSPIAVASGTPTSGPTPLTVQFSSAGSRDPDGQAITYAWTFGDGQASTAANPAHTYSTAGNYTAQLTVRDPGGRTGVANVPIAVGNTAPTVNLTTPVDGGFFTWGDQVRFTVAVTDPEDGTIDCSRVTVQYYLGHDEHAHPMQSYTGCSGIVQTSLGSGHGDDANTFGVIEATYTDRGGPGGVGAQTGRSTRVLQPKHKQAEFFNSTGRAPSGIGGGDPGVVRETTSDPAGGFQNLGFIEDGDFWSYTPVNLTNIDSVRIRVASPGSGGRVEVRTGSVTGPLVGTATFAGTGGWQTYTDATATISGAGTATGPLFLIAKNPAGDTGQGSIFNVNWVDFVGRGVSDNSTLAVTPGSLAFGSVTVGQTSAAQAVTVTNPGTGAASVSAVAVSGPYTQSNNCPVSLAAGASCTVTVRFAPTAVGAGNGTLSVTNSTTPQPVTVALTGTGADPNTNLAVGATMSASTSGGGFPAGNANDGNANSYWESNNNAFPQWLQADLGSAKSVSSITMKLPPSASWGARTQTLTVQGSTDGTNFSTLKASAGYLFDPSTGNTASASFTATSVRYLRVTVTANTGWPAAQLSELQIFGGGTQPGSATLEASPASLAFGNTVINTTTPGVTVTITNTGTAAATLSGTGISAQFSRTDNCTGTLAAGASCFAMVSFAPTSTGAKTGTFTLASNASNPTLTVNLSGTGIDPIPPTLSVSPPSITFPDTSIGSSVVRQVYVGNGGSSAATVNSITTSGAGFSVGTGGSCGSSIPANTNCFVNVVFAPTTTGSRSGTLTISSNASNPTVSVPLSGNGTPGQTPATLTASAVSFPDTAVGASVVRTATVTNTGTTAAQLSSISASGTGFTLSGNTCGQSLSGGASCTISVTFAPASAGAKTGTVTVSSNASNPTLAINLSGNGISGVTNLAQGKPVTVTSVSQSYTGANAVDGDVNTYWESANNQFPQQITVDLGGAATLTSVVLKLPPGWGARTMTLSVLGSTDGSGFTTLVPSATYTFDPATGNTATIPVSASARHVRLTITANSGWPAGQLAEFQVLGSGGGTGNPDLALNRSIAESSHTQTYAAANAVDGNAGTYWESGGGFPQTLTVDLGSAQTVGKVVLALPSGWGSRTQTLSVLRSTDGSSYTTAAASAALTFNPATGNTVTITFTAASARYVRLNFTANTGAAGGQVATFSVYAS
ncbi:ThuA domain-containing protein [Catellatospora sp. KI3]|uniref:ThuA domain-containing protein n=1 Tax=Catellatospora sp. KI3 TaxID=3041620 RepID=UPI00248276A1|nr:ThuA domain-containing protein [Catellatospora sp. KI3]MDI1466306.1 ThuA domain-containing protein [Catellatospora sp. KI3]